MKRESRHFSDGRFNKKYRGDKLLVPQELILKAKEQIGDKAAYTIAEALHLQKFDEKNLKALCPFHTENTPSFVWNPKNYSYHCFGCGRNFGILDLYMQQGYMEQKT